MIDQTADYYKALILAEVGMGIAAVIGFNIASYVITKKNLNECGREKVAEHKRWVRKCAGFVVPIYLLGYGFGSKIAFMQYDRKHKKSVENVVEAETEKLD